MLPCDYPLFPPYHPTSTSYKHCTIDSANDQHYPVQSNVHGCTHDLSGTPKNLKPEKAKSEMCKIWLEKGYCTRRECWFAHGHQDLRLVNRPARYKTRVCVRFTETGSCPYGSRCSWLHPVEVPQENEIQPRHRHATAVPFASNALLSQSAIANATVKATTVTPTFCYPGPTTSMRADDPPKPAEELYQATQFNEKAVDFIYDQSPSSPTVKCFSAPPTVLMQAAFVDMNCQHKRKLRERASSQALAHEVRSKCHRVLV